MTETRLATANKLHVSIRYQNFG